MGCNHRVSARVAVIGCGVLAVVAGCCPEALYEATTENPVVRLPQDEAPHCYGAEWWYYTGLVETEEGHGYGIEAVVFHTPAPGLGGVLDGWAGHFAVVDIETGEFVYEQVREVTDFHGATSGDGGFNLDTLLVQMFGAEGHDEIHAAMSDGPYAIDLTLEDEGGPIPHGAGGYVPFGLDGKCFYYSRPRMSASGTLTVGGEVHDVTGSLWFDRQWGAAIVEPCAEWDWFSIRLEDGSRVMLFVFRAETDPVMFGTVIPDEGDAIGLTGEDFVISPTASWTSPHTGATYPVAWEIEIASQGLTLDVRALADDQELDVRRTTFNVYWEGLCGVTGSRGGESVAGHAYVELTNYPR
ncbi:MAG: hypothetical protein JXQ73_04385 [Phycisphaerae bacterium]|nr:hypothetical protein [Phycisphaerae bacterium]